MLEQVTQTDTFKSFEFPKAGVDVSMPFGRQPVRQAGEGRFGRTTPLGINVRTFESGTLRARGGQRAGLSKHISTRPSGRNIIQELALIVGTYDPPGGSMQQSNSGRVVTLVSVVQGNIYVANAGDTTWTSPTNNTGNNPPLNFTGVMQSTSNQQKLYFADGANWVYYVPSTNSIETWTATAGTLPVDSDSNKPRLIETWRGRIVVSGLLLDPHNWFMTKVDDPHNFQYTGLTTATAKDAVAGNNGPLGIIGDVVTGLRAYSDDVLIFFGDHTIWQMTGDPLSGGQLDRISDAIGCAWGKAHARDPYGNVYFFGNRPGVYIMRPGQKISEENRISRAIDPMLRNIDTGANTIRMIWDDTSQGMHVFVSPTAAAGDAGEVSHFFFEQRTGAWWEDRFANPNHDPLCCVTFDGNQPDDRVALIGSWDGYVRKIDPDATTDDGKPIESEVVIGPLLTKDLDEVLLRDLQAVLATGSGEVAWEIYKGDTAEEALANLLDPEVEPNKSGVWQPGRNFTSHVQRAAYASYIRLKASDYWAMEEIRARLATRGFVRRRGA